MVLSLTLVELNFWQRVLALNVHYCFHRGGEKRKAINVCREKRQIACSVRPIYQFKLSYI